MYILAVYSFIIILFFISYVSKNKLIRFLYYLIVGSLLFLVLSLRKVVYDVGHLKTDLDDYLFYWNSIDINNLYNAIFFNNQSWKGDYFFYFYSWIIKVIYNNYFFFLGFTGVIGIFLFWYSSIKILNLFQITKYMNIYRNINLIFTIYSMSIASFYFLYANVLRQGLAISLWTFSMYLLFKEKYVLSFFIVLLSLFIHKSIVLVAGIMYGYYFWKKTKYKFFFIVVMCFIIILLLFVAISSNFIVFFYKIIWYLKHMTEYYIKDIIQIVLIDIIGIYLYFNISSKYIFINTIKFLFLILSVFITLGYFFMPEAMKRFMMYDIVVILYMFSFYIISLLRDRKYFIFCVMNMIIFTYGFFVVTYPSVTLMFQY